MKGTWENITLSLEPFPLRNSIFFLNLSIYREWMLPDPVNIQYIVVQQ